MSIRKLVYLFSFLVVTCGIFVSIPEYANAAGIIEENSPTSTVRINIKTPQIRGECSGTLIEPNKVLTAAHCITEVYENDKPTHLSGDINNYLGYGSNQYFFPKYTFVLTGSNSYTNLSEYYAVSYVAHPTSDVAVFTLNKNVKNAKIAKINSDLPNYYTNLTTCGIRNTKTNDLPYLLRRSVEKDGKTFCGNSAVNSYGRAGLSSQKTFTVFIPGYRSVANDNWGAIFPHRAGVVFDRIVASSPAVTLEGDSGGPVYLSGTNTIVGLTRGGEGGINGSNVFTPIFEVGNWLNKTAGITNVSLEGKAPKGVNATMPGVEKSKLSSREKLIQFSKEQHKVLGKAVNEIKCGLPDDGCVQSFVDSFGVRRAVYASDSSNPSVLKLSGAIGTYYKSIGWENSAFAYPISGEQELSRGIWIQHFQGGSITYISGTGIIPVTFDNPIGALYKDNKKSLGYPINNKRCGLANGGCVQSFANPADGSKYAIYSKDNKAYYVKLYDSVSKYWAEKGWENSPFGYPISNPEKQGNAIVQDFENASITFDGRIRFEYENSSGGRIARHWNENYFKYGLQINAMKCGLNNSGCVQSFENTDTKKRYAIYSSNSGYVSALDLNSAFGKYYASNAWEDGRLGYPISEEKYNGNKAKQEFENGVLYLVGNQIIPVYSNEPIGQYVYNSADDLYPSNTMKCGLKDKGCVQVYLNLKDNLEYALYQHNGVVAKVALNDPITKYWISLGWENSAFGYPISDKEQTIDGFKQRFEHGIILYERGVIKTIPQW
ncbi:trypsin-like serine protease [Actinomyces sp. zg-332]|uniref:trypsin-like serine protease n=1 Tax=Actinomyces sp. zg-332 TaxID=2708340 RepID=UPI0014211CE1|nr:trypsin-like serine protease [Actinomyces sp. zg-332]QPK93770.1 trypsin-like serine protease [Actinomyces sp. zg-332]